jgi:sulfur transfer protein SufE
MQGQKGQDEKIRNKFKNQESTNDRIKQIIACSQHGKLWTVKENNIYKQP